MAPKQSKWMINSNTSIKQKHIIFTVCQTVFFIDKSLNIYLKYVFASFDLRENG